MTQTIQSQLQGPAAPNLPLPPNEYERAYFDQLTNVLRLYFNRIDYVMSNALGTNGGVYLDVPNGLFFNTEDQLYGSINTPYPIVYNNTYLNNAITLSDSSKITMTFSGVYNFQYSGQVISTTASAKTIWIWIRRNGTDIGYSTHAYTLTGNDEYLTIDWNFNIDVEAGEYIELVTAADSTALRLEAATATSPHPGISSSVLAVNFIAPMPNPRPTPP